MGGPPPSLVSPPTLPHALSRSLNNFIEMWLIYRELHVLEVHSSISSYNCTHMRPSPHLCPHLLAYSCCGCLPPCFLFLYGSQTLSEIWWKLHSLLRTVCMPAPLREPTDSGVSRNPAHLLGLCPDLHGPCSSCHQVFRGTHSS